MKRCYYYFLLGWIFSGPAIWGSVAHVTLYCESVRLYPATNIPGLKLSFSSVPGASDAELGFGGDALHIRRSSVRLELGEQSYTGLILIALPDAGRNDRGVPEFHDLSRSFPKSGAPPESTDVVLLLEGAGRSLALNPIRATHATARWTRPAGSGAGRCELHLEISEKNPELQVSADFSCTFELLQFTGNFTFQRSGPTIPGEIALRSDGAMNPMRLSGPLSLNIDRTDQLSRAPSDWDLDSPQRRLRVLGSAETLPVPLVLPIDPVSHAYVGSFFFEDGASFALPNLPTPGRPDGFDYWTLVIRDALDADQNGIPDLSDDFVTRRLEVRIKNGRVLVSVVGNQGDSIVLEETDSLALKPWITIELVKLQLISEREFDVGEASEQQRYFRARFQR